MHFLFALALIPPLLLQVERARAAEVLQPEQINSDFSTREVAIKSNFTGIEIVLFGSIDFSLASGPDERRYDVVMTISGPVEPVVVRRKERVAGIWMNGASKTFSAVPGFYATLSSRPLRAIATEETLKKLGNRSCECRFRQVRGERGEA